MLLFVYGTLMREQALSGWLAKEKYLEEARLPGHSLVSFGAYPALINTNTALHSVAGELWQVRDELFKELAKMEESVGYSTVPVVVQCSARGNVEAKAFVYATLPAGPVKWEQKKLEKQMRGRAQMHPGRIVSAV